MIDVEHQSGRRMVPGVHDLEHHAHLFGRRPWDAGRRSEHLEHVARGDPVRPAAVDEQDLLQVRQPVDVAFGHDLALEALLHWRGPGETRVLERLERHRQVAVMDPAELHDHGRQHLLALQPPPTRPADRHHHPAPTRAVSNAADVSIAVTVSAGAWARTVSAPVAGPTDADSGACATATTDPMFSTSPG